MKPIGERIQTFLGTKKNPSSQRAHLIQQICDTLFDDTQFKKLLGQTRQCTTQEIRDIFDTAKAWKKNPQALFWKLVREKQEEIKTQIDHSDTAT